MSNLIEYSSKATAKRGVIRMGVAADKAEQLVFSEGGKFVVNKDDVDAFLGLSGLTEEEENLKLSTGHYKCPHCEIHLSNGIFDFDSMVDRHGTEREAYKHQQHEWACLGCGGEWGAEIVPAKSSRKPSTNAGPSGDDRARSTVDGPVKIVWGLADASPNAKRKEIVEAAVAKGVTPNTAKTQYQYWRKARGLVKSGAK